jgi:hypothetical protein
LSDLTNFGSFLWRREDPFFEYIDMIEKTARALFGKALAIIRGRVRSMVL